MVTTKKESYFHGKFHFSFVDKNFIKGCGHSSRFKNINELNNFFKYEKVI